MACQSPQHENIRTQKDQGTMSQLYTKYHVRTPDEQPLDSGCFVLRPFHSDGTIRDPAAVAALKTYANFLPSAQRELRAEITDWVDTPGLSLATRALNVPPDDSLSFHDDRNLD